MTCLITIICCLGDADATCAEQSDGEHLTNKPRAGRRPGRFTKRLLTDRGVLQIKVNMVR